ncbi:Uncharacterized protein dnm_042040 [Desulfonema magnum]|uniref:Uncharacterized protein n=1 Tax=Desulfonema magnum TaxID=45655 RepID=A0A975BNB3_9BACT|nr:Uncharacterized protein dnm_042040 [Desulfonema magnum]
MLMTMVRVRFFKKQNLFRLPKFSKFRKFSPRNQMSKFSETHHFLFFKIIIRITDSRLKKDHARRFLIIPNF